MICLGSCLVEFCITLKHFVNKVLPLGCFLAPFWTLGVIFGAILNPWGHFWSTLSTFFGVKKTLRRQRCPRSASKRPPWFRSHVLKLFWGSFLVIFQFFCLKCRCKIHVVFKRVFDVFFLCLERFKPVKYSKNRVGSFKNTVYRKSEKIEPRSDFWRIWGVFLVPFLKILRYFVKKIVSWKSSKKK